MRRLLIVVTLLAAACIRMPDTPVATQSAGDAMSDLAERYVKLVLAVGEHDGDYVDAYYGPPEWREEVRGRKPLLSEIATEARSLRDSIAATRVDTGDEMLSLRRAYLVRQLDALLARVAMLRGTKMSFDEESRALYDAVSPAQTEEQLAATVAALDEAIPGEGALHERLERYRAQFEIPKERLDAVFKAAIEGCRNRTAAHLALPEGESFRLEYVTDKAWSGYNWYQGNYNSLIQLNTDFPIYIDRAIDLACHEGYPGHHAYNVMLEKHLVRDRGWMEFTVYPLFSPQSLIAEGSANYGIDVAFPKNERVRFEREVLYPLAGLDPSRAAEYAEVEELLGRLSYAGNYVAKRYLDGEIDAEQAADLLNRYALMAPDRARQRVRFIDKYRAYVINYNLGKDLVEEHVKALAGDDETERWRVFGDLISSPRLPSSLAR